MAECVVCKQAASRLDEDGLCADCARELTKEEKDFLLHGKGYAIADADGDDAEDAESNSTSNSAIRNAAISMMSGQKFKPANSNKIASLLFGVAITTYVLGFVVGLVAQAISNTGSMFAMWLCGFIVGSCILGFAELIRLFANAVSILDKISKK